MAALALAHIPVRIVHLQGSTGAARGRWGTNTAKNKKLITALQVVSQSANNTFNHGSRPREEGGDQEKALRRGSEREEGPEGGGGGEEGEEGGGRREEGAGSDPAEN